MEKQSKEQIKQSNNNEKQRKVENKPGFGDKKLAGPNRPST